MTPAVRDLFKLVPGKWKTGGSDPVLLWFWSIRTLGPLMEPKFVSEPDFSSEPLGSLEQHSQPELLSYQPVTMETTPDPSSYTVSSVLSLQTSQLSQQISIIRIKFKDGVWLLISTFSAFIGFSLIQLVFWLMIYFFISLMDLYFNENYSFYKTHQFSGREQFQAGNTQVLLGSKVKQVTYR